ncbi:Xyloglucan endotransglucosylase/hydrolase protein 22 [Citrus sinensis]|nr:Xyloglucan endotransglucosylase/hydrolase protein 22 [Citrus sinensis]
MPCYSYSSYPIFLFSFIVTSSFIVANAGNFNKDVDITWGDGRAKILNKGKLLTLSLDKASGSGFQSKNEFFYGKFDMQLKLVPNNSAGTVTAYYDKVTESNNSTSGLIPLPIFTLIQSSGIQVTLCYFYIDGRPIREFKNLESFGIPYPKKQSMRMYASLWNADDWATRGGLAKTDWSQAPFTASFGNFNAKACVLSIGISSCSSNPATKNTWFSQELDSSSQRKLKWVQQNYMVYNYCADTSWFPQCLPQECTNKN